MTPERIAELRLLSEVFDLIQVPSEELADLLATAEREAKLREAVWRVRDQMYADGLYGYSADLMAALESKGGE